MGRQVKVSVLGSINADLVARVAELPRPGETVIGHALSRYSGGKGANQAVAAARLSAQVAFYGMTGSDAAGENLLAALNAEGIDTGKVERRAGADTGTAMILVSDAGENMIVVVAGANGHVGADYVDTVARELGAADTLLLQFETPLAALRRLLDKLPPNRPRVIVNPAPVRDISDLRLARIDVMTPNRSELAAITGLDDVESGGRCLLDRGVRSVICTCGSDGSYWIEREGTTHFPAFPVHAVDTTAAGDAFAGALAVSLSRGDSVAAAIHTANAAAALSTTRPGAQPSLPRRREVDDFLRAHAGDGLPSFVPFRGEGARSGAPTPDATGFRG